MKPIKSTKKSNFKYFPFCPGVPWKIFSGAVIPSIELEAWKDLVSGKDITVVCFGYIFETLLSCLALQRISAIESESKRFWKGNEKFAPIINEYAQLSQVTITEELLENYPVPLFLDKELKPYVNLKFNIPIAKRYDGKKSIQSKYIIAKQILRNSLLDYDEYKLNKRIRREKVVTIIMESENTNPRYPKTLNWVPQHVKELSAMLSPIGFKVILVTRDARPYYGTKISVIKPDSYQEIIKAIQKSFLVLSSELDWILSTLILANDAERSPAVFAQQCKGIYDINKHAEFFRYGGVISTDCNWISPFEVFHFCEGA
jgi:hypothetical protein